MFNFGIGQKILIVVVAIFILFAIGLSVLIGTSSFANLTAVKQAELSRMSQIMTGRIDELEQHAAKVSRSFEEDDRIISGIQLLTNFGPYYSDPSAYLPLDFSGTGSSIENANRIYAFQAYLNLIEQLQPVQSFNNFNSISFYLVSPFNIVPEVRPTLAFRLDEQAIYITQFPNKGTVDFSTIYQVPLEKFSLPAPGYFDISSAYSAPPEKFYAENNFTPVVTKFENKFFTQEWQNLDKPYSQIILKNNLPIIQTWYPVKVMMAHPETWIREKVPVGVVVIEQNLDDRVIGLLKSQLGGLDLGLAQNNKLLITSLSGPDNSGAGEFLPGDQTVTLNGNSFYFARRSLNLSKATGQLQAVVFSPVSEVNQLIQFLRWQIGLVTFGTILFTILVVYLSLQYGVNRPMNALMRGVEKMTAGDLTHPVEVRSHDELGQLGLAFNKMAGQLRGLIGSLEEQVQQRTIDLALSMDVGQHAIAIRELEKLLPSITELIRLHFELYYTQVYFLDDTGKNLILQFGTGTVGQELLARHHSLPVGPGSIVGRVAAEGRAIVVSDTETSDIHKPNPLLPDTRSELAVPLIVEDHVIGVLDMQAPQINTFTEDNSTVFQAMATQLALAINSAQQWTLAQKAQQKAEEALRGLTRDRWTEQITLHGEGLGFAYNLFSISPLKAEASNGGVSVPVMVQNEPIGQLAVEISSDNLSEDDQGLLAAVAQQLGQKAENLRLFEATQQSAAREKQANEIGDKIRAAQSLEEALQIAVKEVGISLQAPQTVVHLEVKG